MAERNEKMSTKVIVIIFIGVAFIAGYLVARAKYKPQISTLSSMVIERDEMINTLNSLRNRYVLSNGELIHLQDGEGAVVDEVVTFTDGSRVDPEGLVTKTDGEEIQLNDGDSVLPDGTIIEESEITELQNKE